MTADDETNRRRRLWALVGGGVLVAAAAIGFALAVNGQADDRASDPSASSSSSSSSPHATPTPSATTTPPAATPTSSSSPSTAPAPVESPVPVPPVDARPPVVAPPDQVVDVDGVQVTLKGLTNVTTSGSGPGEISGPGVQVAISVANTGSASADLSALTVNVYQGSDGVPLATVTSDQDNRPVPATVKPGETVTGTYRFVSASTSQDVFAVVVDVAPGSNPVVYQGVHPS